ncbi:MAG: transglutaminase domain-containing protein [Streptosporangiaceae bacterium]
MLRLRSDKDIAAPELDGLRTTAQDLAIAEDWPALHALRAELRRDHVFWPDLWGPLAALAASHVGDPSAFEVLESVVGAGFSQPELFNGRIEATFGDDLRWPALRDQIAHNVPAAPLVLTRWPELDPIGPLGLLALPARAAELRSLAPPPLASAWETARQMLEWVTHRWTHANAHMEIDDAVECLNRVDDGMRFACVEYSLVLCQVLNALGIPSRRLSLRQANYHVGLGRGHAVSEAWIDDLRRWVLLDGQNGLYWTGADGVPLSAAELQRAFLDGIRRPGYVTARDNLSDTDADVWFGYFASINSAAGTWSPGPFGVVFQRGMMATSGPLRASPDALYPDLTQIGVQTALDGDLPALRLASAHPYCSGFAADGQSLASDVVRLDQAAGDHELVLAARTDYGTLPGHVLRYRVTG